MRVAADQDRAKIYPHHLEDRHPAPTSKVAQLPASSGPLTPSSGSRPDVQIKSEGRMRPDGEAGSPETAPPAQPPPTSQGAQVRVTWNGQPDVVMIHSDLEDESDPHL